ncbi:lytic transglycosylase domain-containing protein [Serratia bockelmannii]|uniref:lytic transglycosylase domain-containing protein n=1 Tax=Serratia bockelmannii TaxID=2703793 RepID=UPI003FA75ACA
MGNSFEFELTAKDEASASIQRIEEVVKNLNPLLQKTRDGLALGGQESIDGLDSLNDRLSKVSTFARDNVQFISDMVPPLKMVGELGGKLASSVTRMGALGAAAYVTGKGVGYVIDGLQDAGRSAYELDVAAKNAGMRVDDFTRLTGAMRILGIDSNAANQAVEGLYGTLRNAKVGEDNALFGALKSAKIDIELNSRGNVDVLKTLDNMANVFPTLAPEVQKTLANVLHLGPELLALMREGVKFKELLAKSDKFNLTVDPELNEQLTEANRQMNEFYARYEGFNNRLKNDLYLKVLPNKEVVSSIDEYKKYSDGELYHGNRDKDLRQRALRDDEFKKSLSIRERLDLTLNYPNTNLKKKIDDKYGAAWAVARLDNLTSKLQNDLEKVQVAYPTLKNAPNYIDQVMGNTPEQQHLSQLESQYNLPPGLLDKVWDTESSRGVKLLSPKGAEGPFQFMPPTGRDYGLNTRSDRMDFYKSSDAAARYLSDQLKRFGGDVRKAVASYNWGPNRVDRLGLDRAPWETRDYLQKIMPGLPAFYPQAEQLENNHYESSNEIPPSIFGRATSNSDASEINQNLVSAITSLNQTMQDSKMQIELTLVDSKTGERRTLVGEGGGRVSTSMSFP